MGSRKGVKDGLLVKLSEYIREEQKEVVSIKVPFTRDFSSYRLNLAPF